MARRVIEQIAALLVNARVACLLLLFAAILSFSLQAQIEFINDNGTYLSLAQSLVSGQGYRDIALDGSPAHTKYPPVYPLLLAPLVYLFGLNFWVMRLFSVGIGVLALAVIYFYFRRLAGERDAFTILALTGVSYGIWFYSQSISSEMPYVLFAFLALLYLERYKEAQQRILGKACVAALVVGVACLTRTVGLALLVGAVAYVAFEGQEGGRVYSRSRLAKSGLIAVLGSAPMFLWLTRNWLVSGGTVPVDYLREYGLKSYAFSYATADSGSMGLRELFELAYHNLYVYTFACARMILPYFADLTGKSAALSLTIFVLLGFFICVVKRRTALEYYVPVYLCALLLFPASYDRYLIPLIPIIFYSFLNSLHNFLEFLPMRYEFLSSQKSMKSLSISVITLLIGFNLAFSVQKTIFDKDTENNFRIDVDEKSYAEIIPWVIENTDPSSLIMWPKAGLRYMLSKRRGVGLPSTSDETRILKIIDERGVDYLVIDSFSDKAIRYLNPLIAEHPERFSLLFQNGTSAIYRVEG
jgi:4-amino-4-deoxy-L-arabinose transferase-like glycosyltransferase